MSNLILSPLIIRINISRRITRQRNMLFQIRRYGGGELSVREGTMGEGFDMGEDSETGYSECLEFLEGDIKRRRPVIAASTLARQSTGGGEHGQF